MRAFYTIVSKDMVRSRAIPITNGEAFMAEPLANGRNCLEFSGEADMIAAIEKVLTMSDQEIE